jgi:hypothetical protein
MSLYISSVDSIQGRKSRLVAVNMYFTSVTTCSQAFLHHRIVINCQNFRLCHIGALVPASLFFRPSLCCHPKGNRNVQQSRKDAKRAERFDGGWHDNCGIDMPAADERATGLK